MAVGSIILGGVAVAVLGAAAVGASFVLRTRRIASRAERLVPPCGRFIDVDGERIHYFEAGEGPPIVLVHGLGAQLLQFRHLLFDRLKGFRLIALDRPGSGYSRRSPSGTGRLPEQARLVRRFIDALGLERPLIVAHSLGGMVALTVAIEQGDAISGLALLSPLTRDVRPTPPQFRPLLIPSRLRRRLLAETTAIPAALKAAPETLAFVFGPQLPHPDYMVEGGGWLGLRPRHFEATVADFTALGEDLPALAKRYGSIDMPVGILFGDQDRVLDHAVHGLGMDGAISGIDIEIVEGVGHMLHYAALDQTERFIRRIARRAFDGASAPR